MSDDTQAMLDRVREAIAKVEGGAQSYTLGNEGGTRQVTRATLSHLYERERELMNRLQQARGPRPVQYVC